jgi:hypothetical protein
MAIYKPLGKSLEEFSEMSLGERKELTKAHYKNNWPWIVEQFAKFGAEWIMVSGDSGEIVAYGQSVSTYPTEETKKSIGKKSKEVLFTLRRPPSIDFESP